ncbi:hypothetical protein AVEN_149059-1, partial [Araneus ventricosus]
MKFSSFGSDGITVGQRSGVTMTSLLGKRYLDTAFKVTVQSQVFGSVTSVKKNANLECLVFS